MGVRVLEGLSHHRHLIVEEPHQVLRLSLKNSTCQALPHQAVAVWMIIIHGVNHVMIVFHHLPLRHRQAIPQEVHTLAIKICNFAVHVVLLLKLNKFPKIDYPNKESIYHQELKLLYLFILNRRRNPKISPLLTLLKKKKKTMLVHQVLKKVTIH